MSDIAVEADTAQEQVIKEIKRGFSLKDRLEKRGLRKAKITLFLDENAGARHLKVVGEIEALDAQIKEAREVSEPGELVFLEEKRAELVAKRDDYEKQLHKDALIVSMRAVPPVIAKDCRRLARQSVGIEEKGIPDDKAEDFLNSYYAHLLSFTVQSIEDTASGEVNEGLSYEDAIGLAENLPSGQYARLRAAADEVQFRDAFSQTVEAQEDFS